MIPDEKEPLLRDLDSRFPTAKDVKPDDNSCF